MMRPFALAALCALTACGSGGTGPIVGAALEEAMKIWPRDEPDVIGDPLQRRLRRVDIETSDTAAIWARLESDPSPTVMYALSDNGGYVTYLSQFRQSVTLLGSKITGTRGLGTDLLSATSSAPDPLVRPVPPGRWPAGLRRTYELPGVGPVGQIVSFDCVFEPVGAREMIILERRYRGVEISETCTGPTGTFENLHFADAQTGFVWRSLQWVGWQMELVDLQILEPYTP
jgi:hypothetical protein